MHHTLLLVHPCEIDGHQCYLLFFSTVVYGSYSVLVHLCEVDGHQCYLLFFSTVVYGSYSVLVHLCEVDGKIPFSSSSAVLMIELCKVGSVEV